MAQGTPTVEDAGRDDPQGSPRAEAGNGAGRQASPPSPRGRGGSGERRPPLGRTFSAFQYPGYRLLWISMAAV